MSKKIRYTDEPIGDVTLVADFLPSPEELKLKNENTKGHNLAKLGECRFLQGSCSS